MGNPTDAIVTLNLFKTLSKLEFAAALDLFEMKLRIIEAKQEALAQRLPPLASELDTRAGAKPALPPF